MGAPGEQHGDTLLKIDFGVEKEGPDDRVLNTLLDDLVGCDNIKTQLQDLRDVVQYARETGDDPQTKISYNYLFLGNPGTARLVEL